MYRWLNVDVEVDEDGVADVRLEGRGEFPFSEHMELEPNESGRVHAHIEMGDLSDQPDLVEWYMKNSSHNETVASSDN